MYPAIFEKWKQLTFEEIQQEQPQLYTSITASLLNADEQAVVQSVILQAERNAQQDVLNAQQLAAANGTSA